MRSLIFLLIFLLGVIATPAQADWQARHYSDEFTDVQICRVIQGGVFHAPFSDITQLRVCALLRLNNPVNGIDIGLGRGNDNVSIRPLPVYNTAI